MTQHSRVSESALALHIHYLHKEINKKIQKSNAHYKSHVDLQRRHLAFNEGEYVMIRIRSEQFSTGTIKKLNARKASPYKILKKINPNAYVIDLPSNFGISLTFNISNLIAYKGPPFNPDNSLVNLDEFTPKSFFERPYLPPLSTTSVPFAVE